MYVQPRATTIPGNSRFNYLGESLKKARNWPHRNSLGPRLLKPQNLVDTRGARDRSWFMRIFHSVLLTGLVSSLLVAPAFAQNGDPVIVYGNDGVTVTQGYPTNAPQQGYGDEAPPQPGYTPIPQAFTMKRHRAIPTRRPLRRVITMNPRSKDMGMKRLHRRTTLTRRPAMGMTTDRSRVIPITRLRRDRRLPKPPM